MPAEPTFAERLDQARGGDGSAQGELLRRFEPWLRLLARVQLESRFAAKFDASDIVQQTLLEAVRAFPQFRASTEVELTARRRQILTHALAQEVRRGHSAQKRDMTLEVSPGARMARSSQQLIATLVLSALHAVLQTGVDLSRKPPEQHYSWFGWWMNFAMGAYLMGGCLVSGHIIRPATRWLWRRIRQRRVMGESAIRFSS